VDAAINEEIVRGAQDSSIVNIAGSVGIGAFGALAQRARAFVGITTGTMHVSAAAGAPTVGIFPFQTDFPERWAPLGRCTAVVRASYPCHRGDTKETCCDYACIANLDIPRILATTESVLAAAPSRA
jgi:ADP-heptose:LPS heptosyltransferase